MTLTCPVLCTADSSRPSEPIIWSADKSLAKPLTVRWT